MKTKSQARKITMSAKAVRSDRVDCISLRVTHARARLKKSGRQK